MGLAVAKALAERGGWHVSEPFGNVLTEICEIRAYYFQQL